MSWNRRKFLGVMGCAVGGLSATGLIGAVEPVRKTVTIAGKRATVIDIHAHCVVPEVQRLLQGTELSTVKFNPKQALDPSRVVQMDRRGIDIQVLSINRFWWYRADTQLASRIVRLHDQHLAEWCANSANRFAALSSVALQFPELAAQQLDYAVKQLGLKGASIAGHMLGEPLSSPRFDPFWAKAQELDVPVFMHPTGATNVVREGALDGPGDLNNIIGNPLETTVFLSDLIFNGTLDRFPQLKICAAHAGGFLPSYLGRTEVACKVRPKANCSNRKSPSDYLKDQISIDSMIFSSEGLRHLVAEVGVEQIVYGSDSPFNWPDTIDIIANASFLNPADKRAILGGNLTRLLRLATG
jgi:aminocarboxymuconate-semialdehyde decarboxylase